VKTPNPQLWIVALAWALPAMALAGQVEVDPPMVELDLDPGEIEVVTCRVTIPCDTTPPKADIYLLADTTGSMGAILAAVQDAAGELTSSLLGIPGVDVRIGVGQYRDFNDTDPFAFEHQLSPTDDEVAIAAAFDEWSAAGGSDPPEAQLYALTKIARDPAIGFREGPDVKRIVVWFGDRPGHDPICENIHQDGDIPFDITEETTTADLLASGATGTTVVAISTRIGKPGALDEDPDPFAVDYEDCEPDGEPGQATRITGATNGLHIDVLQEPEEIVGAILDAVEQIFERVDVSLEAVNDIVPFVQSIEPPVHEDVEIPLCEEAQSVELEFVVTFEGQPCIENEHVFFGGLHVNLDGVTVQVKHVTITQEICMEQVCLMVIGAKQREIPVGPDPRDILLLEPKRPKRDYIFPVTMESIPTVTVPDDPKLEGKHIYVQVYMNNAIDFPRDPIQLSNGLDFIIGSGELPRVYGPATTIDLWGNRPLEVGGALDIGFRIEGM